jgi:hypothetical protein
MAEHVFRYSDIGIPKKGESFDIAILAHVTVGHIHVSCVGRECGHQIGDMIGNWRGKRAGGGGRGWRGVVQLGLMGCRGGLRKLAGQ